ncbi:MAG: type II toxin-antitoxin system mRNA interferase toxin, RelE/StbE family, partial [Phormidium sp.]
MKIITFTRSFKRAYKTLIRKHPELQPKVEDVLRLLAENSFEPSLQTHKLKGQLAGSWACTVEYDCRIEHDSKKIEKVFVDIFLQSYKKPPSQIILDMDVTDDQVHGE